MLRLTPLQCWLKNLVCDRPSDIVVNRVIVTRVSELFVKLVEHLKELVSSFHLHNADSYEIIQRIFEPFCEECRLVLSKDSVEHAEDFSLL